jgi:hypothetical protein
LHQISYRILWTYTLSQVFDCVAISTVQAAHVLRFAVKASGFGEGNGSAIHAGLLLWAGNAFRAQANIGNFGL